MTLKEYLASLQIGDIIVRKYSIVTMNLMVVNVTDEEIVAAHTEDIDRLVHEANQGRAFMIKMGVITEKDPLTRREDVENMRYVFDKETGEQKGHAVFKSFIHYQEQ